MSHKGLEMSSIPGDSARRPLLIQLNLNMTSYGFVDQGVSSATNNLMTMVTCVDDANTNWSGPECEWLKWHNRLGHMSYHKIQFLMRSGVLAHTEATRRVHTAICKLTSPPMCAACHYGQQWQCHTPGQKTTCLQDQTNVLKQEHLQPGQCVSTDHFICSTKGHLFTSKGNSKDDEMYSGGCIFVDHASGFLTICFQTHLNLHETLTTKQAFENQCHDFGVIPQQYHTDNGLAFTSAKYTEHLKTFCQITTFASVGAHHQNGITEQAIQTVMSVAHTKMLHSGIHWPNVANPSL